VYVSEITSQQLNERGKVLVDGRALAFPEQLSDGIRIRPGQHKLTADLPGLMPVNRTISVSPGTRLLIELKPTPEKDRQWKLRDLEADVRSALNDASDTKSSKLWKELTDLATNHRETGDFADALRIRSILRWPADRFEGMASEADLISVSHEPEATPMRAEIVGKLVTGQAVNAASSACLAFSPDGHFLARGCSNGNVDLWDLRNEPAFRTLGAHGSSVILTAFADDGKSLVSVSKDSIKAWILESRASRTQFDALKGQVVCAALSLDGRKLACAFRDGPLAIYDAKTGQEEKLIRGVPPAVVSVALTPDGRLVALGTKDKIEVWNVGIAQRVGVLGASQEVVELTFSPDNQRLAKVGRSGAANVWRVEKFQPVAAMLKDRTVLAFEPDGRTVAVVTGGRTIEFMNAQSGELQHTVVLSETLGPVCQLAFAPDGRHVAVGHANGVIHLLRLIRLSNGAAKKS
jgi:WD40 repeat protein